MSGLEVHDLGQSIEGGRPVRIPITVSYKYVGPKAWKGKTYAAVTADYSIDYRPPLYFEDNPRGITGQKNSTGGKVPLVDRITGKSTETMYWDVAMGQAAASVGSFNLLFHFKNGATLEFRARSQSELLNSERMDRKTVAEAIKKDLKQLGVPNATVKQEDEGVTISLDNIQFEPDSAVLMPSEQTKLDRIGAILKKYPDRDIVVSGHTALAGTPEERQKLSVSRAASVADYLLNNNVRTKDKMMVRGFGADKPVADNTTAAGRAKNRRVEITLLEN
jgi:outer membrane protein OmpA-like peptidoglycan-associated protein